MTPRDIWLEYLGNKAGLCKGKGTLHLADKKLNIPGLVSSLGADFSMAVGTALAAKMRKTNQVTLYYVGEGTCNQADAHPSMCMAALWQLPVVFAVCTNQFCELSYMCDHYPTQDVAPRAAGYGIPGDPGQYVNPKDLEEWAKKDPIDLCRKKLVDRGNLSETEAEKIREGVQAEVDEAVREAFAAADPTVQDLFEDLYSWKGVL
jgi:pyruvate dehydrogenase E1 component alpha subunit